MVDNISVNTEVTTFYIENNILYSIYKEGVDVNIENIEKNIIARKKMQKGEKYPTLVDVRKVWQFSDEARKLAGGDDVSGMSTAIAVVTGYSMPIRMVANFFMKFNRPTIPTQLFKTKKRALAWLDTFKD